MRKTVFATLAALLLMAAALPLAACDDKGPGQQVGEKIDQGARKLRDAVDPPKGPGEQVGRAVDRAANP